MKWSKSTPPALTVESGAVVEFDTIDGSNGQIQADSTIEAIKTFQIPLVNPVFGPIYVQDAQPGDALEIEVLELRTADWGWTAIVPGFGLLADEFSEPGLKLWKLPTDPDATYVAFKEGIHIPLAPFMGEMGVAPGEDGEFSTIPPYATGGNLDCRHLTVGTRLYLPVKTPGALFSCGDGHAAQGDGETCGTGIETPMHARLRLTVRKNHDWVRSPHYQTVAQKPAPGFEHKGDYAAMGIGPDILEATKDAARGLIEWLQDTHGLERTEAYMLVSVAADLKLVEVVDMPNYAVAASIPLNIFVGKTESS